MTQREQEHKTIWLAPWCDKCERDFYYPETCRTWCQDDAFDPCDECGALSVKYVLATDQPSADGESVANQEVLGPIVHTTAQSAALGQAHLGPRSECQFEECRKARDEQSMSAELNHSEIPSSSSGE